MTNEKLLYLIYPTKFYAAYNNVFAAFVFTYISCCEGNAKATFLKNR